MNGRRMPFGCHAWERYDPEFWRPHVLAADAPDEPAPPRQDAAADAADTPRPVGIYRRRLKRTFDLAAGSLLFALALPLLGLVSAAVLLRMGRPVFYRERRAGRGGRPFWLWKFRTMTNEVDAEGRLLPDDRRLTPLGRLLRRTSLDELPELWHVVRGEMSLVGPRPLPVRYLSRYSAEQARRLDVPPGVTGLAQIRGRNALNWDDKFALDVWYVDHVGFRLDLSVLAGTVQVVLRGDGVSHPGHATMEEFLGSAR
jgi:lipopolysaccharide/colanic/teichoic acid biosynthesis glycosyltransferase